jgi:hypothetical protein
MALLTTTTLSSTLSVPYSSTIVSISNPILPHRVVTPYASSISSIVYTPLYNIDYEYVPELNDSFEAQKNITRWLLYRILDKWIYTDEMSDVLKYMKIVNGKVQIVKSYDEYKNNLKSTESDDSVELKKEHIEEYLLDMETMKKLLRRVSDELGIHWTKYDKKDNEIQIVKVINKYLHGEFNKLINMNKY